MSAHQRTMKMIGFLQAQNCSIAPGSWRHPAAATDYLTPDYFVRVARILEEGKFHLAFFDDRLALPDIYNDSYSDAVENGIRVVKMDPATILAVMAGATRHLGLGATYSTTYYEPFHVARLFATLDLMSGGRAAWNIVTSLNDSEAANFGRIEHLGHAERYDRADEFVETVLGHWDSWDDDALIIDKKSGRFADAGKVRAVKHEGKYFRSHGPLPVPRSPQGHPLLIQAGQSGRGRQFATRWGELIFVIYPNLAAGQKQYAELKAAIAETGRNPESVAVAPACYVNVAETESLAREKEEFMQTLVKPLDGVVLLSEGMNFDFGSKDPDSEFTDEELRRLSWGGYKERIVQLSGKSNPTVRDFLQYSAKGTTREMPNFTGTPSQVADQMEEWFKGRACDGFVLVASHYPSSFEDFTRLVVPELQRRGLYHQDYTGTTLRDNLGLARPAIGAWKGAAA